MQANFSRSIPVVESTFQSQCQRLQLILGLPVFQQFVGVVASLLRMSL